MVLRLVEQKFNMHLLNSHPLRYCTHMTCKMPQVYNQTVNLYRLSSCNPGDTLTGRDGDKSNTLSDAVSLSNQCFDRIKGQARIARVIVWPEIRHQLRRVRAVDVEQMPVHLAKPTANTNHNTLYMSALLLLV